MLSIETRRRHLGPLVLICATATCLAAVASHARAAPAATPFAGETIFGDSLSDGGNLSILAGSSQIMRFTTNPGMTAVEDLGVSFGLPTTASLLGGTNYAVGGAGVLGRAPSTPDYVPTETQQITTYLAAHPQLDGRELYTVEAGANDVFYHGTAVAAGEFATATGLSPALVAAIEGVAAVETPAEASAAIVASGTQEAALIAQLQTAGAKAIVVINLPDTGRTISAARGEALVPGTEAEQTLLSDQFNATLNAGLANAQSGIIAVNLHGLFNELLADPAAFGITNTTTPACTTSSSIDCTRATLVSPTAVETYLFADGVHPTTTVHEFVAQAIAAEIVAPQLVSLLAEQPLAVLTQERQTVLGQLLAAQAAPAQGLHLFAAGGAVAQTIDDQRYLPGAHATTGTMSIGAIDTVRAGRVSAVTFGVELTGSVGQQDSAGRPIGFDSDAVGGTLFAQYSYGPAYLDGLIGADHLGFSNVTRRFEIGPVTRAEHGDTHGVAFQTALDGGFWFGMRGLRVGPFVSLAYADARIDDYRETSGDSTAMWFGAQRRQALLGSGGARLQGAWRGFGVVLHPYAELAYVQDFDAQTREVTAGPTTLNGQFSMPGFTGDRRWGEAQGGVAIDLNPRLEVQLGYQGRFAGRTTTSNGGNGSVSYRF